MHRHTEGKTGNKHAAAFFFSLSLHCREEVLHLWTSELFCKSARKRKQTSIRVNHNPREKQHTASFYLGIKKISNRSIYPYTHTKIFLDPNPENLKVLRNKTLGISLPLCKYRLVNPVSGSVRPEYSGIKPWCDEAELLSPPQHPCMRFYSSQQVTYDYNSSLFMNKQHVILFYPFTVTFKVRGTSLTDIIATVNSRSFTSLCFFSLLKSTR